MNGHVFQCYEESTAKKQYHRTIEELSGYVGINLVHPEDIKTGRSSRRLFHDENRNLEETDIKLRKVC